MDYPIRRVSRAEWNEAASLSSGNVTVFSPPQITIHHLYVIMSILISFFLFTSETSLLDFVYLAAKYYDNEVPEASVFDYHQAYLSHKVHPSDVIKIAQSRIREWELEKFPIFSSLNESDIMDQAIESDARYLNGIPLSVLDGVPIAFKDVVNIRNHITRNGKKPSVSWQSGSGEVVEDTLVKRFRDLGSIIFGITIMTGRF